MSNTKINDGHGLWDNEGLTETLITDLNNLLKNMAAGQYIRVCSITMEMVQKLTNLKNGIKAEKDDLKEQIQGLKQLNNELAEKAFGVPVDSEEIPVDGIEEVKNDGTD